MEELEDWQIAFAEKRNLHPNILKDIEHGICSREVSNKLAVFSYELRQAVFGEEYTISKVYRAYKKSKTFTDIKKKLDKIEEYRSIYQRKAKEWETFLKGYAIKKGYVYILSNDYMPGLVKIGYTEKEDVSERRDELYYQGKPGVPYPFNVEFAKHTVWPDRSEKAIHERLWEYRINMDREFFKISLKKAKNVAIQVIVETERLLINHYNEIDK